MIATDIHIVAVVAFAFIVKKLVKFRNMTSRRTFSIGPFNVQHRLQPVDDDVSARPRTDRQRQ